MLSPEDLKAIMVAADADPNKVGEALHCMLDAEVYLFVHLDSTSEEAGFFSIPPSEKWGADDSLLFRSTKSKEKLLRQG